MNLYELQAILSVLLPIAGPAIGAVYTWWATRSREAEKKVDTLRADVFSAIEKLRGDTLVETGALDKRMDALEQRLGSLEQFVRQLPDRESFHELDKRLTEMGGKVDTITVSLVGQSKSLERIENFLIESARSTVRASR